MNATIGVDLLVEYLCRRADALEAHCRSLKGNDLQRIVGGVMVLRALAQNVRSAGAAALEDAASGLN